MTRIAVSRWFRTFAGAIVLGAFVFLSNTGAILSLRERVLDLAYAFSQYRIGFFVFPQVSLDPANISNNESAALRDLRFEEEKLRREVETLRTALGFSRDTGESLTEAHVFSYLNEVGKESLLVDRGRRNGIDRGALVFDSHFIFVGVVVEATDRTSKIDIASNPGNTFEGVIISTNTNVVARGMGGGVFSLDLVPVDTPVRAGDFVEISPRRGYPPAIHGLYLGEVVGESKAESIIFKSVRAVSPAVASSLSSVFIFR